MALSCLKEPPEGTRRFIELLETYGPVLIGRIVRHTGKAVLRGRRVRHGAERALAKHDRVEKPLVTPQSGMSSCLNWSAFDAIAEFLEFPDHAAGADAFGFGGDLRTALLVVNALR